MLNKNNEAALPPEAEKRESVLRQRKGLLVSTLLSRAIRVRRRLWLGWYALADLLDHRDLRYQMYRWCAAFRSFLAHIRIQSSKMSGWVDLGPLGMLRDGRYQNHERIQCRAEGIETLRANFPWVDSVDIRLFLLGLDAGEKYCMVAKDRHAESIPEAQQLKV